MKHPGYCHAREFFSAEENGLETDTKDLFHSATILWEPDLLFTMDSSNVELPLSISASPSVYQVIFQGMSSDGYPISEKAYIKIN